MKKFSNLPISVKVGSLVGLLLLTMAGMGLKSYLSLETIGQRVEAAREADAIMPITITIMGHFNDIRARSYEYKGGGNPEVWRFINNSKEKLRESVTELTALDVEEFSTPVNKVLAAHEAYKVALEHYQPAGSNDLSGRLDIAEKEVVPAEDAFKNSVNELRMELLRSAKVAENAVDAEILNTERITAIVVGLAFLMSIAAYFISLSTISRPIRSITGAMRELASGKLEVIVPHAQRLDEVGQMAAALQVFKDSAIARRNIEAKVESDRLKRTMRQEEVDQLVGMFGLSVGGVFTSVSAATEQMAQEAARMQDVMSRTSVESNSVLSAAEQTAQNVQQMAAAAEELSASISEIAQQVERSATVSKEATIQASAAMELVNRLNESASRIGQVVEIINEIASQTNLLALNATIEAARAGEAGKGFAVVAGEVKTLASQTGNATTEISTKIAEVQVAVGDSINAIREIGKIIEIFSQNAQGIAAAITEQQSATQEIARSAQQISTISSNVTVSAERVLKAADDAKTSATTVNGAASNLSSEANVLSGEVQDFLGTIRSATDGDTSRLTPKPVSLPATVMLGEREVQGRLVSVSTALLDFEGTLSVPPGTQVRIMLEDGRTRVWARVADRGDGRIIRLQLPLDSGHMAEMEAMIARLAA